MSLNTNLQETAFSSFSFDKLFWILPGCKIHCTLVDNKRTWCLPCMLIVRCWKIFYWFTLNIVFKPIHGRAIDTVYFIYVLPHTIWASSTSSMVTSLDYYICHLLTLSRTPQRIHTLSRLKRMPHTVKSWTECQHTVKSWTESRQRFVTVHVSPDQQSSVDSEGSA
jgi:hypothetical protein